MENTTSETKPIYVENLAEFLSFCSTRPLFFVQYAFIWGKGALIGHQGPGGWSTDILQRVQDGELTLDKAFEIARGASARYLFAWLTLWHVYTCKEQDSIIVMEGDTQECITTWTHLSKWARLCLGSYLFTVTATFAEPQGEPSMVVFDADRNLRASDDDEK